MRYELPQFINIQDKIFGPFTFKQFVYLAGGGAISYTLWQILPTVFAIIVIIPIVGLALALGFYKVNGRPFIHMLYAATTHALKSKFYLWHQTQTTNDTNQINNIPEQEIVSAPMQKSQLRKIAWNLDVLDMNDPNANREHK
jgi:hypothetical protein